MFTSRAEYRLMLRADNAEDRLTDFGIAAGLVCSIRAERQRERARTLANLRALLARTTAPIAFGSGKKLADVARRPEVTAKELSALLPHSPDDERLVERAIIDIRYESYLGRQRTELKRAAASEHAHIPPDLDMRSVVGLCAEAVEVLARFRPVTLGQASRLAGISPSDVSILEVNLRRRRKSELPPATC